MIRLLIAIRPEDLSLMSAALGDEFDVIVCTSFEAALDALQQPVAAIGCGLHFDDGRMFDLLRHVKGDPKTRAIPFFCIKGAGGDLSPAILQSIEIATRSTGADGFLDLGKLRATHGDAGTFAKLREYIRTTLAPQRP